MQAVLLKADAHMQQGIDLADRRAFYSARTEFLAALRLLAQGLDAQDGGTARSEALARGIWALEEVNDFIPRGSALNADIRVDRLVAAHRTTVLKSSSQPAADSAAAEVTPLQAVQKYYTYAQEQLAAAVRPSREGSQLLTALGKLYAEMNGEPARLAADAATKGLVCQQAALLADGNNARAANELGVLLAREGRFEEARDWLRHSARLKQQPETWHNLAVVHAGLGETQLAAAARNSSLTLARRQGPAAGPQLQVKQVTPAQFAGQSRPAGPAPALAPPPANAQTAAKASDLWDWLPWR
jgi:Flp pilus assembly protein TadD